MNESMFSDEFAEKIVNLLNEKLGHEDTETWISLFGGHEVILNSSTKVDAEEFYHVKKEAIILLDNEFGLEYVPVLSGSRGFTLHCY